MISKITLEKISSQIKHLVHLGIGIWFYGLK